MKKITYLLISILLLSCSPPKDDLQFEKDVFLQVFPQIIDSLYFDSRGDILIPPPPPNASEEEWERYKEKVSLVAQRKLDLEIYPEMTVVVISDTIYSTSLQRSLEVIKENGKEYIYDSLTKSEEYIIDLSKIRPPEGIEYRYLSSLGYNEKIFRKKYPFHLGAVVSFSRITFTRNKEHGLLDVGIAYAPLNGAGHRFFIKKDENGNWIIDNYELIEIS